MERLIFYSPKKKIKHINYIQFSSACSTFIVNDSSLKVVEGQSLRFPTHKSTLVRQKENRLPRIKNRICKYLRKLPDTCYGLVDTTSWAQIYVPIEFHVASKMSWLEMYY